MCIGTTRDCSYRFNSWTSTEGDWGYRSNFMKKKSAFFTIRANGYHIGILRFTENKNERFGKSRFTTTGTNPVHV